MDEKIKKEPGMFRLVLVLFIICVITSLLLGLVYSITEDPIAENKARKTAEAKQVVLPAEEYIPEEYTGTDKSIVGIERAILGGYQAGWVVQVTASGFGGAIDMVVGIDMDGLVRGIDIVKMSETSGLGANADNDSFKSQFIGLGGKFAVSKDGGSIQALTGATVTSRAVTNAVNSALAAVDEIRPVQQSE